MSTILITGCSSGYGQHVAQYFLDRGWTVIATMRTPRTDVFAPSDRLRILPLDVTKADSIHAALEAAGPIDALVNNAGIGVVGAFEATPMEHIRKVFETNTFGTMAMTQAAIPAMRERGSGVIVNVTSSVTLAPMPLAAAYTASKQAIQGFTQSLAYELAPFGIVTKLVEPGYAPTTRFSANTDINVMDLLPGAYLDFARPIFEAFASPTVVTRESDVAEAVWHAVTDGTTQQRYPAGADAVALAAAA